MGKYNNDNHKLSKRKLSIAIAAILICNGAYAQQAEKQENTDDIEVIEVSGLRTSATKQLNSKRFSKNISDGIFAEDMGKMADENIAEAMQRITGVGIESIDGEGSQITIRGVEGSFNNVQLNGQTLTSSGNDGSVDFSSMSADMLKSIEVIKSPSANQDEGSLGGTVKLNTWRPLDIKDPKAIVTVQAKYNDLSNETDQTIKASFGKNYSDNTFGFTTSFFYDKVHTRLDKQTNYGWRFTDITAKDSETGEDLGLINSFEPVGIEKNLKLLERVRFGGTSTFQYNISDNSSLWLDLSYTRQEKDSVQHNMRVTGLRDDNIWDADSGSSVVASAPDAGGNILTRLQGTETDTTVAGLNYQHLLFDGDWTLDVKAGWSGTKDYWPVNRRLNYNARDVTESATSDWLDDNGNIQTAPSTSFDNEYGNHWNPETLPLDQIWFDKRNAQDDLYSFQIDLKGAVDFGPIVGIAFGTKYTDRTKVTEETSFNTVLPEGAVEYLADNSMPFPVDDFMERVDGVESSYWPVPDMGSIFDDYFPNPEVEKDELGSSRTEFSTIAGYLMADYELFEGSLLGDFGVRVVKTDSYSWGASGYRFPADADPTQLTAPSEGGNTYTNVLPSFNGRYVLSEEMLLRFSAAKVMARPQHNKLTPGTNIILQNRTNPRATGGNPELDPTVANQFDISWEWYFQDTAMVSVAGFYKDIKSLTYTKIEERTFPCPIEVTDETLCDLMIDVPTTLSVNGDGGEVYGAEISYQQDFSFLPGMFKNFGTIINYTYTDSEATYVDPEQDAETAELLNGFPLENTSRDTFNGILYWENKTFSARFAYNYRSKRLDTPVDRDASIWVDDRSTLDFSSRYEMSKKLALTFAITNLTDTYDRAFVTRLSEEGDLLTEGSALSEDVPEWRTYSIDHSGRNFRLGLTYKF